MQTLRTSIETHGRWWLLGLVGVLVLLVILSVVLHLGSSQAQRQAPTPTTVTPVPVAVLTWTYQHPKPTTFVIRRSLDAGLTWQDLADVPGARGKGLTWQDTTLPPPPLTATYVVLAVKEGVPSVPSTPASITLDTPPQPWACTSTRPDDVTVILTCTAPAEK